MENLKKVAAFIFKEWMEIGNPSIKNAEKTIKSPFIVLSVMLTILPGSSKCHFPSRLAHPVVSFYAGLYASSPLACPQMKG